MTPTQLLLLILAFIVFSLLAVVAGLWLRVQFAKSQKKLLDDALERLQTGQKGALELLKKEFDLKQTEGESELDKRKQAVDSAVGRLEDQLKRYESLVKGFESDRDRKYGSLETELKRAAEQTTRLQQTTAGLVAVLGNVKIRGQWGQKMAQDILSLCGLQEGIQYVAEKSIGTGRPDYTFFLPGGEKLYMDVKFPFDNYWRFTRAESVQEQQASRDAFVDDVRNHLKEMQKRSYVSPGEPSLDYIVIFIPNEQVYGVVNEWIPELFDESIRKKMILCGPWTLYAVLRVINQAWENYRVGEAVQGILAAIGAFQQDYSKFKERFEEVGKRLAKVQDAYAEVTTTSYKRMDQRIRAIEQTKRDRPSKEPRRIWVRSFPSRSPSRSHRHD